MLIHLVLITLVESSGSIAVEGIEQSAENVEGSSHYVISRHEVKRRDAQDDTGVSYGWNVMVNCFHCAKYLLTNQIGYKEEYVIFIHCTW